MNEMLQLLLGDLRAILKPASEAKRESILCRVIDLFCEHANILSPDRIAAFDEVLGVLIENVSTAALADVSRKLAALENVPPKVTAALASHGNIVVARPLLETSTLLGDDLLVEIAKAASQKHLAVIALRKQLSSSVTDALVDRADYDVLRLLVSNTDASISELGFAKLINRVTGDRKLVESLGRRADFPAELEPFLKLAMAS